MKQATIKAIGSDAISEKDHLIILFGPEATPELQKVSVIQEFKETTSPLELLKEGKISFDHAVYTIKYVGDYAFEQLNTIGHATLVFQEVPTEDHLVNGIYLEPYDLPKLSLGSIITYH